MDQSKPSTTQTVQEAHAAQRGLLRLTRHGSAIFEKPRFGADAGLQPINH